jgi:hypothetical protein
MSKLFELNRHPAEGVESGFPAAQPIIPPRGWKASSPLAAHIASEKPTNGKRLIAWILPR